MLGAMRVLSRFKFLRGTPADPFGYFPERRLERRLIAEYETMLGEFADRLNADKLELALQIAKLPEQIRGYGEVKFAAVRKTAAVRATLLQQLRAATPAEAQATACA